MEVTVLLWISGVGAIGVIAVLVTREIGLAFYDFLHWPKWLVNHFDRQRAAEVDRVLDALGVRQQQRRSVKSLNVKEQIRANRAQVGDTSTERISGLLARATHLGTFPVGRRRSMTLPYYIDLLSESLSPDSADECAQLMLAKLYEEAGDYQFERVIGIKAGSPLIAAAVAKRLSIPLVLHRSDGDGKPPGIGVHSRIDGEIVSGELLLLVDDSATGGRMARECIETVKELDASVSHVLVFFEPLGKGGRGVIEGAGSTFVSVVKMTPEVVLSLQARRTNTK
jgi:orotate phosphoribosyltransferase